MRVGMVLLVASIAASSAAPLEGHKEYELVPRAIVDQPGDGSELLPPTQNKLGTDSWLQLARSLVLARGYV